MGTTKAEKVRHVKNARQTRDHHCHWPECDEQVPPAKWGCYRHWMMLPKLIRDRIWNAYAPGQERTMRPSREYLDAADAAQQWIRANYPSGSARTPTNDPKAEAGDFSRPAPAAKPPPKLPGSDRVLQHRPCGEIRSKLASLAIHFARRREEVRTHGELVLEEWSERCAIRIHDGGLGPLQAELLAYNDTVEYMNARFAR